MKSNINILFASLIVGGSFLMMSLPTKAQRFSLKPHAEIGLGNVMSKDFEVSGIESSAHSNEFGLDFGYTFFQKGKNALEVNIGLGYRNLSLDMKSKGFDYHYNAPAAADMDGNEYIRYYEISDMRQKVNAGYLTLPVYLDYAFYFTDWFALHADLGVKFGFKCSSKIKSVEGESYSYGIYPEYADLMIDADWLNDFGNTNLANANKGCVPARGFDASLLLGLGLQFRIVDPLWLDLGIRYDCGFSDLFRSKYDVGKGFTSTDAPVVYTVAEGQTVKSLTSMMKKSKLNPLYLNVGFTIKF